MGAGGDMMRHEWRKVLWVQKCFWVILGVLALRLCLCAFVPEQKDPRLKLSQKQYDAYLDILEGAWTEEKSAFLTEERTWQEEALQQQAAAWTLYETGQMDEATFTTINDRANDADRKKDALAIFLAKDDRFSELMHGDSPPDVPPVFFDEYGWQTVFSLYNLPDILFFAMILWIAAQMYPFEHTSGMDGILRVTKRGRVGLARTKIVVTAGLLFAAGILFGAGELLIFAVRGFLNDPGTPIYSVINQKPFALTTAQGLGMMIALRTLAGVLFGLFLASLSVWCKTPATALFAGVGLFAVPYLTGIHAPFWFSGFAVLKNHTPGAVISPLLVLTAVTAVSIWRGGRRWCER